MGTKRKRMIPSRKVGGAGYKPTLPYKSEARKNLR
jgi:hypothetical protein